VQNKSALALRRALNVYFFKPEMNQSLFRTISKCRICGSADIPLIIDLGGQPPANSLRDSLRDELPAVPLALCQCGNCSTVQLTQTIEPAYLFSIYVWVTGSSGVAREYSVRFCAETLKRCCTSQPFVLEIASNDGTFLKQFKNGGLKVLGVDPAKNISEIADKDGIPTLVEFFGVEVAEKIVAEYGLVDCVFARNVIAHVENIHGVIEGMAKCLKNNGTGVVEFHYSKVIYDQLHYDSIYHEHLFYYSLQSACYLLEMHGLYPFDVLVSPVNGGGMALYFSKEERPRAHFLDNELRKEKEGGIGDFEAWVNFGEACVRHRDKLVRLVEEVAGQGELMIGYGASARSSTLLNFSGINKTHLNCIADGNPLKHGKYTAGTDIPIVAPDVALAKKPDAILLLAWNLKDEILNILKDKYKFYGKIIVPLPGSPKVINLGSPKVINN